MKKWRIKYPKSVSTLDLMVAKSSLDRTVREQTGYQLEFVPNVKDFERNPGHDVSVFFGNKKALQREFLRWMKETVNEAQETLLEMYINYAVLPSFILQLLGRVKARQLTEDAEIKVKLRSLKDRQKDAAQIKEAAKLALKWLPYVPQRRKEFDRTHRAAGLLSRVAASLPKLGPSRKGRRKRPAHVMAAASELSRAFKKLTGRPRYRAVEDLLQSAFPGDYVFRSGKDLSKIIRAARKELRRQVEG